MTKLQNKEDRQMAIEKILEPYFITLDGRDREAEDRLIMELSGKLVANEDTYAMEFLKECLGEDETQDMIDLRIESNESEVRNEFRQQVLYNANKQLN